jgi:hypothetical protein
MDRVNHWFWLLLLVPKVDRPNVIKGVGTSQNNVIDGCHANDTFEALLGLERK